MAILRGSVKAVCISETKGVQKHSVPRVICIADWGIEGDAHAGKWHRQVSLLSAEQINKFSRQGYEVEEGGFGENIIVTGLDLKSIPVGSHLNIGDSVILEITQIGKECHTQCTIGQTAGKCIMPKEGIFATVQKGGVIEAGADVQVYPLDTDAPFTAAVITLSDRAFQGIYPDKSGPVIYDKLTSAGYNVLEHIILPDDIRALTNNLMRLADQRQVNLIITTGGTGFAERDITPEATKHVCEKEVPGIGEALRSYSMSITSRALLSRQTAGIRKRSLIVNLPGSPQACEEDLTFLLPLLPHGLGILRGTEWG